MTGAAQNEPAPRPKIHADLADETSGRPSGSYTESADVGNRPAETTWPETIHDNAFIGLAGKFVNVIGPQTESDIAAILVQFLTDVGNLMGRTRYYEVEAAQHYGNLFVNIVGGTSKARKGTARKHVDRMSEMVDPDWFANHTVSGLGSGEGLIACVRDRVVRREPVKLNGRTERYEEVEIDPGVTDKRCEVIEPEFAETLQVCARPGCTLSAMLRKAWDGSSLQVQTRNTAARATGALVSFIGHITVDELRRTLTATEMANGLGNRFLWVCARRARELPFGGHVEDCDLIPLAADLRLAVAYAQANPGRVSFSEQARRHWVAIYRDLSAERSGMLGALLARAEAQVVRIALIYSILDRDAEIQVEHLLAALAIQEYVEGSVKYIFGEKLGDPDADVILDALLNREEMSREQIVNLFNRHASADRISRAQYTS